MMGLEPTTFCMARTVREVTGSVRKRTNGSVEPIVGDPIWAKMTPGDGQT